jgi:hypothetical protein
MILSMRTAFRGGVCLRTCVEMTAGLQAGQIDALLG